MHALPEKLKAVENTLEASFKRRLVEHKLHFEKELENRCKTAEDDAFQRISEAFTQRLDAFRVRLDDELPEMRGHLDKVIVEFKDSTQKLSKEFEYREETMATQVIGVQAEVPTIHARLSRIEEDIRELGHVKPTLSKVIDMVRTDTNRADEDLHLRISQEMERAKAVEAVMAKQLKEQGEASAEAREAIDERLRLQTTKCIKDLELSEERLKNRVDLLAAEATKAREKIESGAKEARQPLFDAIDVLKTRLDEYKAASHEHTTTTAAQLQASVKESCEKAEASANQLARGLVAELRHSASMEVVSASTKASGEQAASDQMHQDTIANLKSRHEDVHLNLQAELKTLRQLLSSVEATGKTLVAEASHIAEQRLAERTDEVQMKLRSEGKDGKDEVIAGIETAAARLREEMTQMATACRDHAKTVGEASNEVTRASLSDTAGSFRGEVADKIQEAHKRMDMEREYVISKLNDEGDTRIRSLENAHDLHKKIMNTAVVELNAKFAGQSADISTRLEGLTSRTEEAHEKVHDLRTAFDGQLRALQAAEKAWQQQLQEANARLDSADKDLTIRVDSVRDRAADQLRVETFNLQAKITAATETFAEEMHRLRVELQEYSLRREVSDQAAATAKVTAELSIRLGNAESVLDRARERMEMVFRELQERTDAAHAESADAKARMQSETSTLGTELSGVRAAATSLTHGVLKALQIIGLLHMDIDVVPQRTHDGRVPLVQRRWGVEVGDLLEWEKIGNSLASRVVQQWQSCETAGATSMMSFIERKANDKDLHAVSSTIRLVGAQFPKGASIYGQGGADERIGGTLSTSRTALEEDMCSLPASGGHLNRSAKPPSTTVGPRAPPGAPTTMADGRTSPLLSGARKLSAPGGQPV